MRLLSRFLFFCAIAPAFGQTTLNVSQDLVRLGIASSNMLPNQPSQDSAPLLSKAIAYALANRISQIVANQGAYYLINPQTPYSYVSLVGSNNLTIDFRLVRGICGWTRVKFGAE